MKTSKLIKDLRKKANISQANLAKAVGLKGTGGSQLISNIERNICHPPFEKVPYFATVLGVIPKVIYQSMYEDDKKTLENKYKGLV